MSLTFVDFRKFSLRQCLWVYHSSVRRCDFFFFKYISLRISPAPKSVFSQFWKILSYSIFNISSPHLFVFSFRILINYLILLFFCVLFYMFLYFPFLCCILCDFLRSILHVFIFLFSKRKFNSLTYFWLCWVFIAVRAFSLVVVSKGPSLVMVCGLLTAVASLIAEHRLQACGLQWLRHMDSVGIWSTQAEQLWYTGLVAQWHVRSSQLRDWTHVSCIGRKILYHWTSRETLRKYF